MIFSMLSQRGNDFTFDWVNSECISFYTEPSPIVFARLLSLEDRLSAFTLSSQLCNENPIYVFLFWELRALSPNFPSHVSVSDLYLPRFGPHIPQQNRQIDRRVNIYKCLTDTWIWKLELWPRNSFSGNMFRIFGILGSFQILYKDNNC